MIAAQSKSKSPSRIEPDILHRYYQRGKALLLELHRQRQIHQIRK